MIWSYGLQDNTSHVQSFVSVYNLKNLCEAGAISDRTQFCWWMPLCTEKQARAAAYILTRNVRILYSPQFERGLESEPKKDTSTHKCMLDN